MLKKLSLLFFYIKTIKRHTKDIKKHFIERSSANDSTYLIKDMDYDYVYRLYTVINLKPEIEDNVKKYGYYYLDGEIRKFIKELEQILKNYGLTELVGLTRADQIGPNNILIVVEYKLINTSKLAKYILFTLIFSLIGLIIFLI